LEVRFHRAWAVLVLSPLVSAQKTPPTPLTVPAIIDHNRVVIEVELPLPDGSTERVHAWVDNGNPELNMSHRLATLLGLAVTCGNEECSSSPPHELIIAGRHVLLTGVKKVAIPLKSPAAASVMAPGLNAEINIPSSVLRQYDVLIDFPERRFTIGPPGTIHFLGPSAKVLINAENGLIQVPSRLDNKKYNLALDLGSSISFLMDELFDKLAAAHPEWPHLTGAVGPANLWGREDEPKWKLMRLERVEYGPLFLTDVAVVDFPKDRMDYFAKRAGIPTAGLLGSQVLLNYRVGLDYAHSTVYFDIGRLFNFPDFDVVGLILRPEDDGRFTILGVADAGGQPSVPTGADGVEAGDSLLAVNDILVHGATMGQMWSMLRGMPGQERKLTVARAGKQFTVTARVQQLLGETADEDVKKKKSRHE
jgi:hypothetical protein